MKMGALSGKSDDMTIPVPLGWTTTKYMEGDQQPNARRTSRTFGVLLVALVALAAHPYAPLIALIALSVWALFGAKQAIQTLSLVVLIKFLNPAIYQFAGPVSLWGWIALATAGSRIFYDNLRMPGKHHPVIPWLLLFAAVIFIQSLFFSHHAVVSVFKVVSFTFSAAAVLLGFKVTASRSVDWTPWVLGLWIAVLVVSAPTWFVPGIGFARNGSGFQGILNHPQTFGIFLAPMVAWVTGRVLFPPFERAYWLYAMLLIAWCFLVMTRARTALIAVLTGFAVIALVALWNRPEWRKCIGKGMFRPVSIFAGLALVSLILLQPSLIVESATDFIQKGKHGMKVEESFEHSRGGGIAGQWGNFKKHPLVGIGFGVSLDKSFKPVFDEVTGLPLSASMEKGFLPSAVLEETGAIGTMLFLLFLFALFRHVFSETHFMLPWMFLTSLFVNVGEMIFFSAGGFGLYIWLLMGWATCPRWEKKSAP
jgi:hypothetical protein